MRKASASTAVCLVLCLGIGSAFSPSQLSPVRKGSCSTRLAAVDENPIIIGQGFGSRRNFLVGASVVSTQWAFSQIEVVLADNEDTPDLATQLFNPDGSLKEGEVEEARSRTIEFVWGDPSESSDRYLVNIDGKNNGLTDVGSKIRLSYKIPEKWQQKDGGYFDKSITNGGAKTCEGIHVYRPPGKVSAERLAKATSIGLAEALYVTDDLQRLKGADLISGRTRKQGDIKFYDFDMAVAPKTCSNSADNLGLGFCPFDTIYLLSAAVLDDALYVIAVECDKSEWKVASSDLKRVRSSFVVDVVS